MHSFFRAVRVALRYRFTLAAAMLCSVAVGILWGGNIGALYPFIEVVFRGESLQESLTNKIATAEEHCRSLSSSIQQLEQQLPDADAVRDVELRNEIGILKTRLAAEQRCAETNRQYIPYVERFCPQDPFLTLVAVIGVLILGTALKNVFFVANVVLISRVVQLAMVDLQHEFFRRTLRQDLAAFHEQAASGLVGRFVNEMRMVAGSLDAFLGAAVREPLKMTACLVGAAMISWQLLLISMLAAPIGILLLRWLSTTIKRVTQHSLDLLTEQIRRLTQSYGGFVTIKAFTLETQQRCRFRYVTREIACMAQKISFFFSLSKPVTEIMAVGITSVAILTGTYLVLNRETHLLGIQITERPLEPAALMVFFGLLAGMADPARKLSGIFGQIYMGVTASRGVFEIMDRPVAISQVADGASFGGLKQSLTIEDMQFAYQPGALVLDGIKLEIGANETIAFVGPNGCGKSTLVKLLLRFYDPNAGRICIDGRDLREYRVRDIRRRVGLVTQETWLFDDTVAENIRCGNLHATDEEVVEAARKAHADEFICQDLPLGYQTMVGESGCRLSGGQRQRIALARVILRDPSIVVLDEATSEIDLASEQLILASLAEFTKHRTTIMITHRLSSLALADRIVVFERGRILDVGTDEELKERCDVYRDLLSSQLRAAA